jgi:hypothetical protein
LYRRRDVVDDKLCKQILETLEPADREIIENFLKCGEDAILRAGDGGLSLELRSRPSAKGADEDVVDQCDMGAQIIYEGCCDSEAYSPKECAAIAAQFFDHCCTIYQP